MIGFDLLPGAHRPFARRFMGLGGGSLPRLARGLPLTDVRGHSTGDPDSEQPHERA
jgi:hypothetical protein